MSPAGITEWDKTFSAWAPPDPGPQRAQREHHEMAHPERDPTPS
jgi:hypothetical protein